MPFNPREEAAAGMVRVVVAPGTARRPTRPPFASTNHRLPSGPNVRVQGRLSGVGIGNSLHAGQVIVADGTPEMRVRLERVLTNDPGIGVARHADAGYDIAVRTAEEQGIQLPMRMPR